MKNLHHSPSIDYVRALAIVSVFFLHYTVFFRGDTKLLSESAWYLLWRNGYYGVTTFFVVSGYLITSNFLRANATLAILPLMEFYKARAARILPGMLALLTTLLILAHLEVPGFFGGGVTLAKATFYVLTFRANLIWDQLILPWVILWSLAVEEVFYLGYPILAKFLSRKLLLFVLGIFVAGGPLTRFWIGSEAALFSYLGCFEQIAMGCFAAFAIQGDWIAQNRKKLLLKVGAAIWVAAFIFLFSPTHFVVGPTLIGLGTALFLIGIDAFPKKQPRHIGRAIMLIGGLSYEIYLTHLVILQLARQYVFDEYSAVVQRIGADLAVLPILAFVVLIALFFSKIFLEPVRSWARSSSSR